MKNYDSKADTLEHIRRVNTLMLEVSAEFMKKATLLNEFALDLMKRAVVHDESKLHPPEKALFDKYTPLLREVSYGSEAYNTYLQDLREALDHHYGNNSHHPEHYSEGVSGMTLVDLVEMLVDWKAATERHDDGDIFKSIIHNQKRFKLDQQIVDIFVNTATEKWMTK